MRIQAPGPKPAAHPILPPRPNLGPELLPDAPAVSLIWAIVVCSIAAIVFMIVALRLRAIRKRRRLQMESVNDPANLSARIRAAEVVRRALIGRFGEEYAARTTEELREDGTVVEQLGTKSHAEVVALLGAADLEKFGAKIDPDVDEVALDQRVSSLLDSIRAGARSRRSGRWSEPTSGPIRRERTATSSETNA